MKKLVLACAAIALTSAPAYAAGDVDSADFAVGGTVQSQCHLEAPADVDFGTFTLMGGGDDVPGAQSLQINNGSQTGVTDNVWMSCNYNAQIKIEADGMLTDSTWAGNDAGDFTNEIHYRVELKPTDTSFTKMTHRTAGGSVSTQNVPGAFHNEAGFKVYVDGDDNNPKRPVAGIYTDIATLTLGPV